MDGGVVVFVSLGLVSLSNIGQCCSCPHVEIYISFCLNFVLGVDVVKDFVVVGLW